MNSKSFDFAGKIVLRRVCAFLLCCIVAGFSAVSAQEVKSSDAATYQLSKVTSLGGLRVIANGGDLLAPDAALKVRWRMPINGTKIKRIVLPPQETRLKYILIETEKHDLIAIRRDNGQALWWVKLNKEILGDIFIGQYSILFVSDGRIVRLERMSGDILWNVDLPFAPSAGPVAIDEDEKTLMAFIPGLDRVIYALDVESVLWPPRNGQDGLTRTDFQVKMNNVRVLWRFTADAIITNQLLFYNDRVYTGCWTNKVYGISITEASTRGSPDDVWEFRTHRGSRAAPVGDGPYILQPSLDHTLYCLGTTSGGLTWRYIAEDALYVSPQIIRNPETEEMIILQKVGHNGNLIALNRLGGKPRWKSEKGISVVSMMNVDNKDPNLRFVVAVNNEDGSLSGIVPFAPDKRSTEQKKEDRELQAFSLIPEVWRVDASNLAGFVANTFDPNIYALSKDGSMVVALELR